MTKRALVLSGGGARGAFQVGMLLGLTLDRGLDFQVVRGVSVGALNAAFLAQAPVQPNSLEALRAEVRALERIWRNEIRGDHTVYSDRGGFPAMIAGADSLHSLRPLRELIRRNVNVDRLRSSGRDFKVGTVSLVTGMYREFAPSDRLFIERLVASASIPVIFPFVELKNERDLLVDGGVRNVSPLGSAFEEAPDEIYLLLASRLTKVPGGLPDSGVKPDAWEEWDDNWLGTKVNGLDVLKRTVEILTDEIYLDDFRGAVDWNEILAAVRRVIAAGGDAASIPQPLRAALADLDLAVRRVGKRVATLYILAPQEWHGDDNSAMGFSPSRIDRAIDHGRQVAMDPSVWIWPQARA